MLTTDDGEVLPHTLGDVKMKMSTCDTVSCKEFWSKPGIVGTLLV